MGGKRVVKEIQIETINSKGLKSGKKAFKGQGSLILVFSQLKKCSYTSYSKERLLSCRLETMTP